jgi:organic radical activating enzyme
MIKNPVEVRDELNAVSPSFCLAKWQQVTVHLQTGHTHSCHHPMTHKIPLDELANDPSALHNTNIKKSYRKQMLDGIRPRECQYCWNVEDANPENLSDRHFKSADEWAYPHFDKIKTLPWNASVNPSYVEISFGNECNFKCAYCAPNISSAIMTEYVKHGHYSMLEGFSIEKMKESGIFPISKDQFNPYVEAFWKWWPSLRGDLKVFRITGGEPLLNPNTFQFLEQLKINPLPELSIAINSNLGVPKATLARFIKEIKYITENKLVKNFQLFTSVDTYGKNSEFIRFGLNYEDYMNNVRLFLTEVKDADLVFMCTYNALSVINFSPFLKAVTGLKKEFRSKENYTRVLLDTPYLRDPKFLSCYILNDSFWHYIEKDLAYLKESMFDENGNQLYYEHEVTKFERILSWLQSLEENKHREGYRILFARFVEEYCKRKEIKFTDYCPEYVDFLAECQSLDTKVVQKT